MLKRITNITGDIHGLNLKSAEVEDLAIAIICYKNNIYIACRLSIGIVQSYFCQRTPRGVIIKEEWGSIIRDEPVLAKPDGARYHGSAFMKYATNTEWVLRLIFCAVRHFIVEWTETVRAVTLSLR